MPDDEPEPEGHERLVSTAYDRVGDAYLQQFGVSPAKDAWRVELARRTVPRGHILDLGCGAGVPVARDLIDAGFQVTGIDGSPRQIALACENVPGGVFIVGDMAAADFPAGHFDGVAAFFSILHVPRRDHAELMRKIARWLRPGAAFVGSFTIHDSPGWVGDWLGAPMFFNGFDDATNRQIVADAGLAIELAEVCAEDNDAPFLWLAARKTEG